MREIAEREGIAAVDGVALDLGVSSMQLDEAERGFSFSQDGPLDMRMGAEGLTASDLVNALPERDLAAIIATLGEEKRARAIARAILARRAEEPITRTGELADIVARVLGRRHDDPKHPATRTFQALRLYLNDELVELARGMSAAEHLAQARRAGSPSSPSIRSKTASPSAFSPRAACPPQRAPAICRRRVDQIFYQASDFLTVVRYHHRRTRSG